MENLGNLLFDWGLTLMDFQRLKLCLVYVYVSQVFCALVHNLKMSA